jgi:MoaA/NifB/PqqE/SkfB family radical SAM enzyme
MEKSNTYCALSHMGMSLQNESDFCCCNVNKRSWKNNQHEVMHVHSHPLKDVYKSYTRKMIATALDHNIKHSSCQVCWDFEEAGSTSPRLQFNNLLEGFDSLPEQPRVLIIKPGNTCNFACRMCNPMTSTSWYADGHMIESPESSFTEYTKQFEIVRNSYNRDRDEFWSTLKSWMENLRVIYIYGGEPFLIPGMWDTLQHGKDIDASKNITVDIHTNASIWNEKYLEILASYKKVQFHISIDSMIPEHNEYIRHKSKHTQVIDNTKKFISKFLDYPNVDLNVTVTVTPLNVYYIDQIVEDINKTFNVSAGINIVTTPEYDIRHIPQPVKLYLIKNLKTQAVANFLKNTIPGCDIEWPRFCQVTDKLDNLRNQSFSQTFPDWWNLLKPYWVSQ